MLACFVGSAPCKKLPGLQAYNASCHDVRCRCASRVEAPIKCDRAWCVEVAVPAARFEDRQSEGFARRASLQAHSPATALNGLVRSGNSDKVATNKHCFRFWCQSGPWLEQATARGRHIMPRRCYVRLRQWVVSALVRRILSPVRAGGAHELEGQRLGVCHHPELHPPFHCWRPACCRSLPRRSMLQLLCVRRAAFTYQRASTQDCVGQKGGGGVQEASETTEIARAPAGCEAPGHASGRREIVADPASRPE